MRPPSGAAVLGVASTLVVGAIVAGVILAGPPDGAPSPPAAMSRVVESDATAPDARPVMNPCHACHP